MRVVMVCGFALAPKATVSMRAVPMAQALRDRGNEVTILVSPYDNLKYSGQHMLEDGVPVNNLKIRGRSALKYLNIPRDFLREIRRTNPEIIHVFKPKGFSGLTAMMLHILKRQPFVLDHDDWEGWGGWNEVSNHPRFVKEFINFQEKWIPRRAKAITVASLLLYERLVDAGISQERVFYIPNGPRELLKNWVPPNAGEVTHLRSQSGFQDRVVIWYAGHMDAADEPLRALEVLAEVVKRDRRVAVWVAGPVKPELRAFVQRRELQADIVFLGWLQYETYLRHLAASDIVFYPFPDTPVYRAKCSGKVVEYMSLGKPLVTTPVGQNLEYLENQKSGVLAKDRPAMVEALASLVGDSGLRSVVGQNARQRIWAKFSWENTIEGVLSAYDLALADGASGRRI